MHWRSTRGRCASCCPRSFRLDTTRAAWIGVTPFRLTGFRLRGLRLRRCRCVSSVPRGERADVRHQRGQAGHLVLHARRREPAGRSRRRGSSTACPTTTRMSAARRRVDRLPQLAQGAKLDVSTGRSARSPSRAGRSSTSSPSATASTPRHRGAYIAPTSTTRRGRSRQAEAELRENTLAPASRSRGSRCSTTRSGRTSSSGRSSRSRRSSLPA